MRHREAQRHLADLLAGELSDARRAELGGHLEECEECRAWSETYGFLAQALQGDHEAEHPSSEQIARLAVDAELLTAQESERLADHFKHCADCRRELELSRAALAGAAGRAAAAGLRSWQPSRAATWALALAASLLLAVALAFFVARSPGTPSRPSTTATAPPTAGLETGSAPAIADRTAADLEPEAPDVATAGPGSAEPAVITGRPPGEAPPPLVADPALAEPAVVTADYAIEGGEVTLHAGEMVVLEDGFSIASSASLGLQVGASKSAGPRSRS